MLSPSALHHPSVNVMLLSLHLQRCIHVIASMLSHLWYRIFGIAASALQLRHCSFGIVSSALHLWHRSFGIASSEAYLRATPKIIYLAPGSQGKSQVSQCF
jgi:hypothetical protein